MSESHQASQARTAILGAGPDSLAVLEHLLGHGVVDVTVCAEDEDVELPTSVARQLGPGYMSGLSGFQVVYRSPSVRRDHPELIAAEAAGAVITSATKEFLHYCPCTVIGVTGSNGKTVTTELIAALLKDEYFENVHVGSDYRPPLLSRLAAIARDHVVVMELSSNQLQDLTRSPHVAVVLNLGASFHATHSDLESYIETMTEVVRNQTASDFAILNWSYERVREMQQATAAKTMFFNRVSEVDGAYEHQGWLIMRQRGREERLMSVSALPPHLAVDTALAAAAVGLLFNLNPDSVSRVLREFAPVSHRMYLVHESGGVRFYDDAAATSADASVNAIRQFPEKKLILIIGCNEADFGLDNLVKEIIRSRTRCVLTGDQRDLLAARIQIMGERLKIGVQAEPADSVEAAVQRAIIWAGAGDSVVFSPGIPASSLAELTARGEAFRTAVVDLNG